METSPEKVCFVIIKAREFEAPDPALEDDSGSNPTDEGFREVLTGVDNPTLQELKEFLDGLNEDEQAELVALTWISRGEYRADEWERAVAEARTRHSGSTTDYLLGTPLLPDLLEEGLNALGYTCDEWEIGRL